MIIFIGSINKDNKPTCGQTVKNQLLVEYLSKFTQRLVSIDTINWGHNPLILLKLLWYLLFYTKATFILSMSSLSAYKLIALIAKMKLKRDVIYWVIGGALSERIASAEFSVEPYKALSKIIVEGEQMYKTLSECGLNNCVKVSNFKNIIHITKSVKTDSLFRFVFLSRIHPAKGVNLIIDAVQNLNNQGYKSKFIVDFYGAFESDVYKDIFTEKIKTIDNVSYKGFLDLMDNSNYVRLATYDTMLFPTFWYGEGFPGVVVDAYIAGLPVIASDWNMNAEIVKDRVTGTIIPAENTEALIDAMQMYIDSVEDVGQMSREASKRSIQYDINYLLNKDQLKTLGII